MVRLNFGPICVPFLWPEFGKPWLRLRTLSFGEKLNCYFFVRRFMTAVWIEAGDTPPQYHNGKSSSSQGSLFITLDALRRYYLVHRTPKSVATSFLSQLDSSSTFRKNNALKDSWDICRMWCTARDCKSRPPTRPFMGTFMYRHVEI